MKTIGYLVLLVGAMLLSPFATDAALAQATRTWVSGVGDDVNPCSRTAPCKTFAGAISKTAAGGEISVLDPGGFGTVTITKSITLTADGDLGSILSSSTNGIVINAAPTDVVTISGIEINGSSKSSFPGLSGIVVFGAGRVNIINCFIHDVSVAGVRIAPSASPVRVAIDSSRIINATVGVSVSSASISALATVTKSSLTGNVTSGVASDGAQAKIFVSDSVINGSATAFAATNTGKNFSFGNNTVINYGSVGTITSTTPLM